MKSTSELQGSIVFKKKRDRRKRLWVSKHKRGECGRFRHNINGVTTKPDDLESGNTHSGPLFFYVTDSDREQLLERCETLTGELYRDYLCQATFTIQRAPRISKCVPEKKVSYCKTFLIVKRKWERLKIVNTPRTRGSA